MSESMTLSLADVLTFEQAENLSPTLRLYLSRSQPSLRGLRAMKPRQLAGLLGALAFSENVLRQQNLNPEEDSGRVVFVGRVEDVLDRTLEASEIVRVTKFFGEACTRLGLEPATAELDEGEVLAAVESLKSDPTEEDLRTVQDVEKGADRHIDQVRAEARSVGRGEVLSLPELLKRLGAKVVSVDDGSDAEVDVPEDEDEDAPEDEDEGEASDVTIDRLEAEIDRLRRHLRNYRSATSLLANVVRVLMRRDGRLFVDLRSDERVKDHVYLSLLMEEGTLRVQTEPCNEGVTPRLTVDTLENGMQSLRSVRCSENLPGADSDDATDEEASREAIRTADYVRVDLSFQTR